MRARLEKLKRENQELRNLHQELKNKTQGIHQVIMDGNNDRSKLISIIIGTPWPHT